MVTGLQSVRWCLALGSIVYSLVPIAVFAQDKVTEDSRHLHAGLNMARKRYLDDAAVEFNKCHDFSGAQGTDFVLIADSFHESGDLLKTVTVVDYALTKAPNKPEKATAGRLWSVKADALSLLGKPVAAVDAYKQAAENNPRLAHLYNSKAGEILMRNHKYADAIVLLQKGVHPGSMNGFCYQYMGTCYIELKKPDQAIVCLKKAIEEMEIYRKKRKTDAFLPALVECHKQMVKAYKAVGNKAEADAWQKKTDGLVVTLDNDFFGK